MWCCTRPARFWWCARILARTRLRICWFLVDLTRPEGALKALGVAQQMAAAAGDKVTVLNVKQIMSVEAQEVIEPNNAQLEAFVKEHAPDADKIAKIGLSVPSEIRWAADEIGASLVVMGSHDPTFTDYLIGSNAAHVALHSPGSVLVVR